ncbi:MAG: bifunctional methylenetetrahydrofolate dehydrogenase/methenyltetrahydrofolate cyclohydrolase FolD [Cyanobacteria bacterium NC_groundwater_1444_Ag_S-0.65um_54_12]|nr:bifunctional methylenetetrahydrofolate dehydrogenase/methenyltetrahydrofolate cyclohydrolase FolD [Cyanobacteria bacterium NC_groundwater_1444_Ag_S-0.65um_54_12]
MNNTIARILSGKDLAAEYRWRIGERVKQHLARGQRPPGLAVVLVGDDTASAVYVRNKRKACLEAGMMAIDHDLSAATTEAALSELITDLNHDPAIDGILVQLPLPSQIAARRVINLIDPAKDVDGFHPINAGKLFLGEDGLVACTPRGVMALIDQTGINLTGLHAVVLGRSNIVGKPAALLLLARHATVTLCHSRTSDLPAVVRQGDVVVAAAGKAELVRGDWLKPGALVIDVGINRNRAGKLVGDVCFAEAVQVAGWITPVPGGVGPMTIAMLLSNTLQAYEVALDQGSSKTSP